MGTPTNHPFLFGISLTKTIQLLEGVIAMAMGVPPYLAIKDGVETMGIVIGFIKPKWLFN